MGLSPLRKGIVVALLALLASSPGQRGGARDKDERQGTPATDESRGSDLEKLLYRKLQRDGCIRDPKFRYVISARRVSGRKLQGVRLLRRDPTGRRYDWVGRAPEAELRVDQAGRQLFIKLRSLEYLDDDGRSGSGWCEEKIVVIDLPAEARFLIRRSSGEAPDDGVPLSAAAKRFLAEGRPPPEVNKKIKRAFGTGCAELQAAIKFDIPSRGLVFVCEKMVREPDGRWKLVPCSIARFGRAGRGAEPAGITTVRSGYGILDLDRPAASPFDLGDREIRAVELEGGMRVVFKKR